MTATGPCTELLSIRELTKKTRVEDVFDKDEIMRMPFVFSSVYGGGSVKPGRQTSATGQKDSGYEERSPFYVHTSGFICYPILGRLQQKWNTVDKHELIIN